jgi:hypothetical protein
MRYRRTVVLVRHASPEEDVTALDAHLDDWASQGWRLVSTNLREVRAWAGEGVEYHLFWEAD